MQLSHIDNGVAFDWGKTSADYAKYRDIYPPEFYSKLLELGVGTPGQTVLDLGTGTGVIPRSMSRYGAKWVGADISENQLEYARQLSEGMNIEYILSPAEDVNFPDAAFDAATAVQCFTYFDRARLYPNLLRILKPDGFLIEANMVFMPFESDIVYTGETLILKYNPEWTGGRFTRERLMPRPDQLERLLAGVWEIDTIETFSVQVPFTRESWHGRMRTIRGISASNLTAEQISAWEQEHLEYLATQPDEFLIPHFVKIHKLKKRQNT